MPLYNRLLCIFSLILACNYDVRTSDDNLDLQFPTSTTGESSVDTGTSGEQGLQLDVGVEPKLDVPKTGPLCGNLDVLFVIDNSGSMLDEQTKLEEQALRFIDKLKSWGLGTNEMHIGVVTTDAYDFNHEGCQEIGALVTQTGGYGQSTIKKCGPYVEGSNFMTNQDDLDETLACALKVGIGGSGMERPIDAMTNALDEWLHSDVSGCNTGFHRRPNGDDSGAGLLIVLITDEDDTSSNGKPHNWVQKLEWLRRPYGSTGSGTLDSVSFLALTLDPDNDCGYSYQESLQLHEFANLLPNAFLGSICDEDYTKFFDSSISTVLQSCGIDYVPEP